MEKVLIRQRIRQRDIILLPFPFSDQSGVKVRPALVLSYDQYNASTSDLVVCAMTSTRKQSLYSLFISQADIDEGILYEQSAIRADTLLKIQKSIVIKRIASLKKSTFLKVTASLRRLLE